MFEPTNMIATDLHMLQEVREQEIARLSRATGLVDGREEEGRRRVSTVAVLSSWWETLRHLRGVRVEVKLKLNDPCAEERTLTVGLGA